MTHPSTLRNVVIEAIRSAVRDKNLVTFHADPNFDPYIRITLIGKKVDAQVEYGMPARYEYRPNEIYIPICIHPYEINWHAEHNILSHLSPYGRPNNPQWDICMRASRTKCYRSTYHWADLACWHFGRPIQPR